MLKRNECNVKKVKGDNQYNGFTLAELLAVITVLAIIALIIFPIIKGVVSDSKRKAFEDSVYGLMKSIEMDYQNDDSFGDRSYSYENGKLVLTDLQGEVMDQSIKVEGMIEDGIGKMYIDVKGNVSLTVYNDEWCAVKYLSDSSVHIEKKNDSNCDTMALPDICFEFDMSTGTITDYYGAVYEDWDWDDPAIIEEAIDERCITEVVIPSMINGVPVKRIGEAAFYSRGLTSVVFSDTVEIIEEDAFIFNYNLSDVTFGSNIQIISGYAFSGHHLTTITIPKSVKMIGNHAFGCYEHIDQLNVIYEDESNLPKMGYDVFDPDCDFLG